MDGEIQEGDQRFFSPRLIMMNPSPESHVRESSVPLQLRLRFTRLAKAHLRNLIGAITIIVATVWTLCNLRTHVSPVFCPEQCQNQLAFFLYIGMVLAAALLLGGTLFDRYTMRLFRESVTLQEPPSVRAIGSRYFSGTALSVSIFTIGYYVPLQSLFGFLPMANILMPLSPPGLVSILSSSGPSGVPSWPVIVTVIVFCASGPLLLYLARVSRSLVLNDSSHSNEVGSAVRNSVRIFVLLVYWAIIVSLVSNLLPSISPNTNLSQWLGLDSWYIIPGSLFFSAILDLGENKIRAKL